MNLALNRKMQRLIEKKIDSGQYKRAEDVVQAAIGSLIAQETFGDFKTGELDRLLAKGERSIKRSGTLDGDMALRRRKRRRTMQRSRVK